ncbi:hypothetical protein [Thiobacillus sp.]|uniref:hypothetical protein n=1 Tax=Thiobacillus sp. TaxID=924 RepID=UPI00286DB47E|nr:hypothetical protein [Thiobacillus sp.]
MNAPVIRLGARHKRLAYAAFALLWASGALWLLFHYFFGVAGDFGPEPHPLEKWWLRMHGLAAMLALVAVGSLATNHMRLAWSRKKNRRTGMPMLALTAWLAATGYALYYFSSDDNAAWLPLLHWTVGLALPLALVAHVVVGRRRAPRAHPHPHLKKKPALSVSVAVRPPHASQKASQ